MYNYKAKILNVVDGDTFDLDIDLGFHIHIHERVRVLGIDTPEKRGEERTLGNIVKDYATKRFLNSDIVISSKEELSPNTDSFGRWLVEVYLQDTNLADIYNALGVNKCHENYSEENVRRLVELMQ